MFAGIILITVGIFQAFAGLVGILEDEVLVVTPDYLLQLDATTWGWVHMIIGLIVVAAGFGIFSGNVLARTVGVFAAIGRRSRCSSGRLGIRCGRSSSSPSTSRTIWARPSMVVSSPTGADVQRASA